MIHEKKKILIYRIIWLSILILGIIIPIIIKFAPAKNVNIISDNGYINKYYENLDKTSCEIEVVCDKNVDYAYITVAFYDVNDNFLGEETGYFRGYDNTISSTFSINGKVDSYEILDYDIQIEDKSYSYSYNWIILIDIVFFVFFIASLQLSCKEYEYNGNIIVVYAGFYHHYISVNEIKVDEHNTLTRRTPICLSTTLEDGARLNVTITLSNRISLKINDKLYNKRK